MAARGQRTVVCLCVCHRMVLIRRKSTAKCKRVHKYRPCCCSLHDTIAISIRPSMHAIVASPLRTCGGQTNNLINSTTARPRMKTNQLIITSKKIYISKALTQQLSSSSGRGTLATHARYCTATSRFTNNQQQQSKVAEGTTHHTLAIPTKGGSRRGQRTYARAPECVCRVCVCAHTRMHVCAHAHPALIVRMRRR